MKADFSRGFNPDQKRGKQYRRVLLQQGRVLLDSDAAALVDANDRLLRQEAQDLGTDAGGRGQAFLITQGHLYAAFENMAKVSFLSGTAPSELRIDYNARFRERLPSLLINTAAGGPATVAIELIRRHNTSGNLVIWAATSSTSVNLVVSGDADDTYTGSGPVAHFPPQFDRLVFAPTRGGRSETKINITVPAGQRVWIGLIESEQTGAIQPFWIQPGRYHLAGLMVENPTEASYPDQAFPAALGFPSGGLTVPAGQIAVAYLEGWERLVTALQDPGIRERALSTSLDTTVRTAAIGQVKTLSFATATAPTVAQLRAAFANLSPPDGTLLLNTATVEASDDPCAITLENGFTGRENHLYHFEVHSYEPDTRLGQFKWSREAGSELFGVVSFDGLAAKVSVLASSPLRNGDLVEVLTDIIELGDGAPATLSSPAGNNLRFNPSRRDVGVLAALSAQGPDVAGNNVFTLVQPSNPQLPVTLDARYGRATTGVRLRRWHGLFPEVGIAIPTSDLPALEIPIESGLSVQIKGTFEVGDWWQKEARVQSTDVDGSAPLLTRHGPERLFSPLALLVNSAGDQPQVAAWLDQPFVPAAQMDADHLHYDPTVARQVSPPVDPSVEPPPGPTVQGILDDLLLFGPGQTITKQITHIINGHVTGNWQLSVGDGVNSFGDFNGEGAIHRAVELVRSFAGVDGDNNQRPWSLRLLVKRGVYTLQHIPPSDPPHANIVINDGETLLLEGEGMVPLATADPAAGTPSAGTVIACGLSAGFRVLGSGARLGMENLTFDGRQTEVASLVIRQGHVEIRNCVLRRPSLLLDSSDISDPRQSEALVIEGSIIQADIDIPVMWAQFGYTHSITRIPQVGARVRLEDCDVDIVGPLLRISGNQFTAEFGVEVPKLFEGIAVKNCVIRMAGTNEPIGPFTQIRGLVGLDSISATLSIGDLLFENCRVEAGSREVPGLFLHLAAGPDPMSPGPRLNRIDSVVIRGGRWTLNNLTGVAGIGPFYVGDAAFVPSDVPVDTHIGKLVIADVQMGWSTEGSTRIYGASTATFIGYGFGCAFSFSANEVEIRRLTFFGLVTSSDNGVVQIRGTQRTVVDGLYLEDFQSGGGGLPPSTRVGICSQLGRNKINDLGVTGVGPGESIVTISAGAPQTLFTNCRISGQGSSSGFKRLRGGGIVEFVNCEATACVPGIDVDLDGGAVAIRGCRISGNRSVGIQISPRSSSSNIVIEGTTFIGNRSSGILIFPDFGGGSWERRGPTIINNILSQNGEPAMLIGSRETDSIGGICMGNQCNEDETIQILTATTYFMRGLAVDGEAPWRSKSRNDTPSDSNPAYMTLNCARWSRGTD